MPRTPGRGVTKEDPDYLEKRAKNNEAIRKSREKARNKQKETEVRFTKLKLIKMQGSSSHCILYGI
jgi:Basic region leucine zipper